MNTPKTSSLKVQYDLRPAKQVERRMLVDAFLHLSHLGFPIRDYQYTGFGAFYFVDFILFHKLLGIKNMLSIEHDLTVEERVRFNSPYDFIDINICSANEAITKLSRDLKHILWLDYDFPLNRDVIDDTYLAINSLSDQSILLITVDVEPPMKESKEPITTKEYFEREVGDIIGFREISEFTESNLPKLNTGIIESIISEALIGRINIEFIPLFNFLYADGHNMLTIGGMLGTKADKRTINSLDINDAFYIRKDLSKEPYHINVPLVTRKERHILDSAMPCIPDWQPSSFSLPRECVTTYNEIYRFLPAYAELLI